MVFFLLTNIVNCFNNPVRVRSDNINNIGDIKVYEPFYKINEKNNEHAVIFFTGASGVIPDLIYSNILNQMSSLNITTYVYNKKYQKDPYCCSLIDYLKDNYSKVSFVGHSSGCMRAISLAKNHKGINSLILFDPVDDRVIYDGANIMHKTFDEGNDDRSVEKQNSYHEFLATIIYLTINGSCDELEYYINTNPTGNFLKYRLIND